MHPRKVGGQLPSSALADGLYSTLELRARGRLSSRLSQGAHPQRAHPQRAHPQRAHPRRADRREPLHGPLLGHLHVEVGASQVRRSDEMLRERGENGLTARQRTCPCSPQRCTPRRPPSPRSRSSVQTDRDSRIFHRYRGRGVSHWAGSSTRWSASSPNTRRSRHHARRSAES